MLSEQELVVEAMTAVMVPDGEYVCLVTDRGGRVRHRYSLQLREAIEVSVRVVLDRLGLAGGGIRQAAPDPTALRTLVAALTYRPGWEFRLIDDLDRGQGSQGMTLDIITKGFDSYHPDRGETYRVHHYMPVPPAAFDDRSWRRWLFDQILLVERHEACEFFQLGDEHPYAPSHGPGNDPYLIREVGCAP